MVRDIIQIGDKRLAEKSQKIEPSEVKSKGVQDLAKDLLDTVDFYNKEAAGLSAVQLGILKNIFVVRRYDLEMGVETHSRYTPVWEVVINPEIEVISNEMNVEWEGCLSIGKNKKRLFAPVFRPRIVKVKYLDLHGKPKKLIAEDFFSSLVQHEYDHLNGILFLKYVTNPKNIWREKDLDQYISQNDKMPPVLN